jgi:glycosyltransferase involved in cell wall biosynthesis
MKVAVFNYLVLEFGGGTAKYFIETSANLQREYKDLEITIFTLDEKLLKKILFIYNIYFFGKQDRNIDNKEKREEIKKQLGKVKYVKVKSFADLKKQLQTFDVVFSSNNLLEVLILAYWVGYKNLPPVIYSFHIPTIYTRITSLQSRIHNVLYSSYLYVHALKGAMRLHVLNDFDEAWYTKKFSKKKVIKIVNPFDFEQFRKHKNITKKSKTFTILWVGRLTEQKGVRDLCEIISDINRKYTKKITWIVAGEGDLKSLVQNLATTEANLRYVGYIPQQQIINVYKSADLFLNTSSWESFPYTVLEAQACGLPVIAYNIPGCRDIIEDKITGYLVKSQREMCTKLISTLHVTIFNKNMIMKIVEKKYDRKAIYAQLYHLLTTIS